MAPKIEPFGPVLHIGKGAHWDDETQTLLFVDVNNHSIHSYKPDTNAYHSNVLDNGAEQVSMILKVKGAKHKFVISSAKRLATVTWDGVSSKPVVPQHLVDVESSADALCLINGKCDPSNRIWTGSMGPVVNGQEIVPEKGSLYLIKNGKEVTKCLSKIGVSNGMAWSLDKTKLYYVDTLKERVDSYDYNDATGSIENEKTVFCFKKNNIGGRPEGLTIDQGGMLWVTCLGDAAVVRVDPDTGELKQTLKFPAKWITSVQFGGRNYEDLYVTSAKWDSDPESEKQFPQDGRTFKVTDLGAAGTPSLPAVL